MIIAPYIVIATEINTIIYNYWAILGLHVFLVIFWLCSFAVTASDAHQFNSIVGFCYEEDVFVGVVNSSCDTYGDVWRATAVFGALEL
jgi:hypothetical protein